MGAMPTCRLIARGGEPLMQGQLSKVGHDPPTNFWPTGIVSKIMVV